VAPFVSADETSLRILIVNAEVVESSFAGHEHSNRWRPGLQLRPKESVEVRRLEFTVTVATPFENVLV
jgi:hypothetical protein